MAEQDTADTGPAERAAIEAAGLPPADSPTGMLEWAKAGMAREEARGTATPAPANSLPASPAVDVSSEIDSLLAGLPGGQRKKAPQRSAVDAEVDELFAQIGLNLGTISGYDEDEDPNSKE